MSPIGDCYPGITLAASEEANVYSSSAYNAIEFFSSYQKLLLNPAVLIKGFTIGILMDIL